jgi:two-component system OmpR family sensor kinase
VTRLGRPLSLRARLLLGVVGILVLVFAVVGVVTQAVLRDYLVHRLDTQVSAAAMRSAAGVGDGGVVPGGFPGGPFLGGSSGAAGAGRTGPGGQVITPPACQVRGQASGTICETVGSGATVTSNSVLDGSSTYRLSAGAQKTLAAIPADGKARTVTIAGLGSYRVMASSVAGGTTVVTGLPLADVNDTLTRFAVIGSGVAGVGLLVAFILGALLIRGSLRPLRRVVATAGRVAELPLDRGDVALAERLPPADTDARTEVGAVAAAMNRMLDNVEEALTARQASETRVRQFVADASHELRTPLAAIRGYAELTRRSRDEVPPDVAHALRRVESEAARMTTLVEDLLLLARLDSGRPLASDEIDLSALVIDALSDAHAAGPDHSWQLDLGEEPEHVVGDGARLHQVVANLLANARTHTPPGTTVTVGLRHQQGAVELTVADDGPGIPAPLVPHLFERFARGDSSRSRAAGSTGLGLAIVDAVVAAHAGTVTVHTAPGRTAFLVRLPAA